MITRRTLLIALGSGAISASLPLSAQEKKLPRIGFLYYGARQSLFGRYEAFLQGMRELGYVEGKDYAVEARFADSRNERIPGMIAELIGLKVDLILAQGTPIVLELKRAGIAVPVVIVVSVDPVSLGVAASLGRPGGMFTGLTNLQLDMNPKQLEVLLDLMPKLSRVAVLAYPLNQAYADQLRAVRSAARQRNVQVIATEVRAAEDFESKFSSMARDRAQAVLILGATFFLQHVRRLAQLALEHRLPSIYLSKEFAEAGGLMTYGPDLLENYRRAPAFVDKILKGAKPGEIPFEQPTRLTMVINQKTAKALGVPIPQEILLRADRVIE
jgi:putative tryptophan/tyrosine transport system substrate-binding protein